MRKGRNFIVTLVFVMLTVTGFCQGGGGGGMGGRSGGMGGQGGGMGMGQGMSQPSSSKAKERDLVLSTGLFAIDYETVLEECKVKPKDVATQNTLKKHIDDYNMSFRKASEELNEEVTFLSTLQYMISGGMEVGSINNEMQKLRSYSMKVQQRMIFEHKKLKLNMTNSLKKKTLKKWNKYYEALCEENSFSANERGGSMSREGGSESGRSGPPQGGGGGGMRM